MCINPQHIKYKCLTRPISVLSPQNPIHVNKYLDKVISNLINKTSEDEPCLITEDEILNRALYFCM